MLCRKYIVIGSATVCMFVTWILVSDFSYYTDSMYLYGVVSGYILLFSREIQRNHIRKIHCWIFRVQWLVVNVYILTTWIGSYVYKSAFMEPYLNILRRFSILQYIDIHVMYYIIWGCIVYYAASVFCILFKKTRIIGIGMYSVYVLCAWAVLHLLGISIVLHGILLILLLSWVDGALAKKKMMQWSVRMVHWLQCDTSIDILHKFQSKHVYNKYLSVFLKSRRLGIVVAAIILIQCAMMLSQFLVEGNIFWNTYPPAFSFLQKTEIENADIDFLITMHDAQPVVIEAEKNFGIYASKKIGTSPIFLRKIQRFLYDEYKKNTFYDTLSDVQIYASKELDGERYVWVWGAGLKSTEGYLFFEKFWELNKSRFLPIQKYQLKE